ncbi:MAG TPA: AI-2E family transporter, partial [Armatimonadota bacterium]|nr:AI-2E family transporter [Armatimonadota bacterium]
TQWATRFVTGIAVTSVQWITHIVDLILIPVLAFYFLVEGRGLKREFIGLIPPKRRRRPLLLLRLTGRILRDYTIAQVLLCIIAGIVVYVGLRALGVNYALSLAVLAGVTRAIPIIGPIIGGIPIVLLTASQSLSLGIAVLIFFSALHLVESKLLLPKLVGVRLHIHAALVLIVLLLGGEFAGLFGMFLAAPVAAIIRVLLRMYVVKPGATHI